MSVVRVRWRGTCPVERSPRLLAYRQLIRELFAQSSFAFLLVTCVGVGGGFFGRIRGLLLSHYVPFLLRLVLSGGERAEGTPE